MSKRETRSVVNALAMMQAVAPLARIGGKRSPELPKLDLRADRHPAVQDQVTRRPDPGGRRLTLEEATATLTERHKTFTPGGRSLADGQTYDGRDIPGFGKAAARRLRQMERRRQ